MDRSGANRAAQSQARHNRARGRPSESNLTTGLAKNTCPICFSELTDICAYQLCTHVLCFECSIRNRVLCNKKECPVCRAECDKVVLAGHRFHDESDNIHRFDAIIKQAETTGMGVDSNYGFVFENVSIDRAYRKMLTHSCRFCDRPFGNFDDLVRHVRDRHEMHYCQVCVRTLMLFTWEHKVYMYDELLRHMDDGDPVDKTVQPHPQCELCPFRAFDKDELYRHSKKRHHACWICESSGKLLFFNDFFTLYEHMAHHHHVCKVCSNPAEAKVVSFPDESGLTIHSATEHSDGNIRADVLFNFQQRGGPDRGGGGGRPRRGGDDRREEDEENVRPRTPVQQNFNMDAAQFPTLAGGPGGTVVASGGPGNYAGPAGRRDEGGRAVVPAGEQVLKYGPPRMTDNEFPSLGGGSGKGGTANGPSTSWSNGVAKVTAPSYTRKTTTETPKKITRALPFQTTPPATASEMFPVLSGPAPTAVAKLNRDWTAVPVKNKNKDPSKSRSATNTAKPAATTSRWELPEEEAPDSSAVKHPVLSASASSPGPRVTTNGTPVYVQHTRPTSGGGFDGAQRSSDLFPSLAKPEGKGLPGHFRSNPSSGKKAGSSGGKHVAAAPAVSKPVKKSESALLAESLFKTATVVESDDEEGDTGMTSPGISMAETVFHAAPFAPKADDFPGLAKAKAPPKTHVPERRPDRVQKRKEAKTDWGNTLIQYETVFIYIPAPNHEERIATLHSKLDTVEVKGKLKSLEEFQRELLDETIPPLEFWMECQRIIGKKFAQTMPDVIALLSNLPVQQSLFDVAKVPIYGNLQVAKALVQCGVCKQIVKVGADKEHHDRVHKSATR